ncbi:hypothetical protein QBC32DRAFT_88073 [Pseudoneurospora amorphoporcata]|uniref:Uncharacterized protein n=1 Tax=Pseudoneurospora amorphoporcata TaxID=241081 RepID=A0AAN6P309_9PEZI|nr:hypothetical protein QBC32DRAFT_88073 [Pseudoneurospora amorphoporcata]
MSSTSIEESLLERLTARPARTIFLFLPIFFCSKYCRMRKLGFGARLFGVHIVLSRVSIYFLLGQQFRRWQCATGSPSESPPTFQSIQQGSVHFCGRYLHWNCHVTFISIITMLAVIGVQGAGA